MEVNGNEERLERLRIEAAEKELEYWNLKVDIAKIDKELHKKTVKYFEDNLDAIVKIGLGISDSKGKEE